MARDGERAPTPDAAHLGRTCNEISHHVLEFENNDPANPINWNRAKKSLVVVVGVLCIFNSVFGTSLPSGEIDEIADHFHVSNSVQLVLPITVYQIGFMAGSLTWGPLSETYGRKPTLIGPFACFTIFTLASAWAPTWSTYLAFRFVRGFASSGAVAVTGGLYADIFYEPRTRGRANALFLCATSVVPQLAPFIAGYAGSRIDWRWPLFIAACIAGGSFLLVALLPETYAPVILQRRARAQRSQGHLNVYAQIELDRKCWKDTLMVFLARPVRMLVTEWIVMFTCLYLGYVTGIYYLFFEAYSTIFMGTYHLGEGASRLMLLPVAGGALVGFLLFFYYDHVLHRAKKQGKAWACDEEYRRLPIACAGGPLCLIGIFWLGWTSSEAIPLGVPAAAGFPFGLGFYFILMALNNYLGDAYKTYSASAMAAVSFARSVGGGFLPLASNAMYTQLGVHWATSLLGFCLLGVTGVPFLFIKFGERIRDRSKFCQQLARESEAPIVEQPLPSDRQV